jgi:hypothetical protein
MKKGLVPGSQESILSATAGVNPNHLKYFVPGHEPKVLRGFGMSTVKKKKGRNDRLRYDGKIFLALL